jgi:hypothetical protein
MEAKPNSQFQHFAKREGILLKILEEEVVMVVQAMTTLRTSTSKVLDETIIITHPLEINIGSLFRIRKNSMKTTLELLTLEGSVSV